jgi:murein DD-endopeptidase MepM/ murein hydrolase activator NlpD
MNTISAACLALACLSITPASPLQGEPVMITISGTSTIPVKSDPALLFFRYRGVPTALYGADISQRTGTTTVTVTFGDGSRASGSFVIMPRVRPTESLPVPAQLGGNSIVNQARVLSTLTKENADLAAIHSRTDKALWTGAFSYPVASTTGSPRTVTDPYGYNRDSGANTITHKGVDFHAPPGTPIYAVNRGVVRVAKNYTVYGNSVIIDHGLGLLSMYMHLSRMVAAPGQLIQQGQLIGYSGETGYAEGPHLHLTIRIGGVSIDPMRFFALFGVKL